MSTNDSHFFKTLASQLQTQDSITLVKVVGRVLKEIANSISFSQFQLLFEKLPSTLQLLLVNQWTTSKPFSTTRYLDEMVVNLANEKDTLIYFKSEIASLETILIVINSLDKYFGVLTEDVFSITLLNHFRQAI